MNAERAQIAETLAAGQAATVGASPFATRFLPSLTDVAFVMPMLFLYLRGAGATSLLGDGDTGWHLRAGEWMLANGRVPSVDIFSFTKAGQPWYAWEWLWDAMFGWLHRQWGMAAVIIASTLILSITFALLFRLTRRTCSNPFLAIGAVFFACASSSIHWLARPHLVTLFFVTLFYLILERVREGRPRLLLWLPALTIPWTNLHGGFIFGIVLLVTYAAGEALEWLTEPDPALARVALGRARPYLLTALGCAAASLVNPYFYRLHLHIAAYILEPYHFNTIAEFQTLSFHHTAAIYFETTILAGVAAAAWCVYQRRFAHALLLLSWAHLALQAGRNIPIFAILAAPILASTAEELCVRLTTAPVSKRLRQAAVAVRDFASEFAANERLGRYPVAGAFAACVLILLFYLPTGSKAFRAEYSPEQYPSKVISLLRASSSARIFTTDVWGGYLIYRMYPDIKVFIDGRSDFYGVKLGEDFVNTMNAKFDWEKTLARYSIDMVLLPVDAPLASTLKESGRWRVAYDDKVAILFRKVETPGRNTRAAGEVRVSAVNGSGFGGDRTITNINLRDPRVATSYARR
jgi:hypothetical protein